jgi:hypothetical protein
VLVSPDHAAVAIKEPSGSPVAARMLRLGRAELYHIASWSARIGRLCVAPDVEVEERRLVPAQSSLSITAVVAGRANHVCRCTWRDWVRWAMRATGIKIGPGRPPVRAAS